MKTLTISLVLAATLASGETRALYTELDYALFSGDAPMEDVVARYMRKHNVTESRMTELLLENFKSNYAAYDPDGEGIGRLVAAQSNLGALRVLDEPAASETLWDCATEKWPEEIRNSAVRNILIKMRTDGFPFASNVMTQAWRSPSEHNGVRLVYYAQAKSASPEDREKYVEFFKWAVAFDNSGGFKTWDRQLMELDPSWRGDTRRRAAAEAQWRNHTTEYGTNLILDIIHDYELGAGIRQPNPLPGEVPASAASSPQTSEPPPTVTSTPPAVLPIAIPEAPATYSYKPAIALGAVLLTAIAIIGAWRRKSKARPQ